MFAAHYDKFKLNDNAMALGIKGELRLNQNLALISNAEIERSLNSDDAKFTARINYLGDFEQNYKINKTRAKFSAGLRYDVSQNLSVSLAPYIARELSNDKTWGSMLRLEGRF